MSRVAVIGSGISGLTAGYYLSRRLQTVVFEADSRPGGHADTHDIHIDGETIPVDTGFIVFNPPNYPVFSGLLNELGVASQASDMSFSVRKEASGLEYNGSSLKQLFCQRRNLLRPDFYRMLRDIVRFYREAESELQRKDDLSLGDYLQQHAYSQAFYQDHLYPMACALWSADPGLIPRFPLRYLVAFMANHHMLQVADRPQWRTVKGGSREYVQRLIAAADFELRLGCPVTRVGKTERGPVLRYAGGEEHFDHVVMACHSDQALKILSAADEDEEEILGAIAYQDNHMILHGDARVMPLRKAAWASWNAWVPAAPRNRCSVTYCMNKLQNLPARKPVLASLNMADRIDPQSIWAERHYAHPVYTAATLQAQRRWPQISGRNGIHYCGAYWGWGFHEDGARSARRVVDQILAAESGMVSGREYQSHAA